MTKNLFLFPLILICAEMLTYLSNDFYLPALPVIMHEFNITVQQAQWTLTSWFLGAASMQLLVGPISDRVGRRPVLIAGLTLFVLSTLGCALTSHFHILILSRFVQGSTLCFVLVAGYASIHELYDQTRAIRLLATMSGITVLAPAFGPLLGGLLLTVANWRWHFWILLICGIMTLIALILWMPEPLPVDKRHPLKISLLLRQYKAILTNGRFLSLLVAFCLIFCGFIAWLVAGPFLVIERFHSKPWMFGVFQILIFGAYILATRLVKYALGWWGVHNLIKIGLVIAIIGGVFSVLSALIYPFYLNGLILGLMIYSFGSGFLFAPLQRLAIEASKEPMGSRMAIVSTFISLAGLFASIWAGLLYNGKLGSLARVIIVASLGASLLSYVANKFFPPSSSKQENTQ